MMGGEPSLLITVLLFGLEERLMMASFKVKTVVTAIVQSHRSRVIVIT